MATVLIIGASRGIGLELARQYAAAGWTVHATVRDLAQPGRVSDVEGDVHLHPLEVTDDAQAAALARGLDGIALDVFIHNAGTFGRGTSREAVMAVNAEAPIRVTEHVLPLVAAAHDGKVVLVTSQMGARQGRSGSLGAYADSKAALNDAFRARAPAWRERGVTAIALHPGWVRTDMGGKHASISVQESATGIRSVIEQLQRADHGRFLTWEGREHPW